MGPAGTRKAPRYDRGIRRPTAHPRAALLAGAALLIVLAGVRPVAAQLFFSSEPSSPARIGPLIVRARVTPGPDTTAINVLWSVALPPRAGALQPQPLYLLWPGEISSPAPLGKPDPALAKAVTDLGFDVIGEGRLPLYTHNLSDPA